MEVIAIRHLPTKFNLQGVLQGRVDEDIAEISVETLLSVRKNRAMLLKLDCFDMVLTSSLRRTISSANIYGFSKSKVEPLLDELDFGQFEGKPKIEMESFLGKEWKNNPRHFTFGEPLVNLEKRVLSFIEIYDIYNRILIFGHGAWIRALLSVAEYGDIRAMNRFSLENNGIKIIKL